MQTLKPSIRFKGFTDDWEQQKIGEIGYIAMNKRIYKEQTSERGDVPFYKIGTFGGEPDAFISEDLYQDYKKRFSYPQIGDILLSASGSIGKYVEYKGEKAYFQDSNIIWLVHDDSICNSFLKCFYSVVKWEGLEGSTIKRLYNKNILETNFIFPCIEEQQKVGLLFEQTDKLITLYKQKYEKLTTIKKSLLAKMFPAEDEAAPQIRFKGFIEPWQKRKLGELTNVTSVKRIHQADWTNKGVRFLRARDIVAASKNEEPDDYLYISNEKYEEYSAISGKVAIDDLLVTGVGTIGVPYLVKNLEPLYFKDGNVIWFQNKYGIDGNFFYYSFLGNKVQSFIKEAAGIGTVGTYTIDTGKSTPIFLPQIEEQQQIGVFFAKLDNLIATYKQKYEKLQTLKNSLLNKMFV